MNTTLKVRRKSDKQRAPKGLWPRARHGPRKLFMEKSTATYSLLEEKRGFYIKGCGNVSYIRYRNPNLHS